MTNSDSKDLYPQDIADWLYDIALDPQSLDTFISIWNEAGLDSQEARRALEEIDQFDTAYQAHLNRAEAFLSRAGEGKDDLDLNSILAPFASLAAFILSRDLNIAACNSGAKAAFGIEEGLSLNAMNVPRDTRDHVIEVAQSLFQNTQWTDQLLKVQTNELGKTGLFQFRKLSAEDTVQARHILVVTTRYHWQAALGQTLEEVFGLTTAEQGIVRALVEGLDAKAISADRGTSEGTVRGQIKAVLAKMNARTQSEVIRLVMSLRDVSEPMQSANGNKPQMWPVPTSTGWLHNEVWKPFKTLTLRDGRRLDYHDMGPANGAPVIHSHMGYCMARWHAPMLKLLFQHGLRVICPIRAGYGHSDNIDPKADVLAATRSDTIELLEHLGIDRLPYLTQGNDLIFAADFAGHSPEKISEIIGLCARPSLPGDRHYSGMAKWHRFFLSTAKHAPHLLTFTAKAAITMAKRIGVEKMYRQMNQHSPADMALIQRDDLRLVMIANAELVAGKDTNAAQAYTMELLQTETDWSDLMFKCRGTKTWFVNGGQDPAVDIATISEYRETYPWIDIEVVPDAGQMLLFQHYENLIPRIAHAAKSVKSPL